MLELKSDEATLKNGLTVQFIAIKAAAWLYSAPELGSHSYVNVS